MDSNGKCTHTHACTCTFVLFSKSLCMRGWAWHIGAYNRSTLCQSLSHAAQPRCQRCSAGKALTRARCWLIREKCNEDTRTWRSRAKAASTTSTAGRERKAFMCRLARMAWKACAHSSSSSSSGGSSRLAACTLKGGGMQLAVTK